MKKIILMVSLLSLSCVLQAQDFVDNALLFGRTTPGGSARVQGIGGAQIALGGDFSSALSNPAGLGMFNRSEFTISPAITFHGAQSEYLRSGMQDSRSALNVPALSLAIHFPGNETGYLGGTLGISMTRINDFNRNSSFSGYNDDNSILDYFIEDAGDIHPDDLFTHSLTSLAYSNYLIEAFEDDLGIYYSSLLDFQSANQEEISERKGAQYQWSIGYGANFSDKFFVGASLGITSLKFLLNQSYREYGLAYPDGNEEPVDEFSLIEDYNIRGTGINFTVGATFRPVSFLQIGASFVTPTSYFITDRYSARMQSSWNNFDYPDDDPDNLNFIDAEFDSPLISEYNLSTPLKLSGGIALISKIGFLSADIEYVDYSSARYSSETAGEFGFENNDIRTEFEPVLNYRVGAEYRYEKFRVRGGFNYMSDPVLRTSETSRAITGFSGGLGYREDKFYVDFAATFNKMKGTRIPYFVSGEGPQADFKFATNNYMITVGFPF